MPSVNDVNPLVSFDARHFQFHRAAERLYDNGDYTFAIIAVQTAAELFIEGAIEYAIARRAAGPLAEVVPKLLSTYSMMDKRGPEVWIALTGRSIREPDTVWRAYRTHVERRNALVHKGASPSREDAEVQMDMPWPRLSLASERSRADGPGLDEQRNENCR